MGHGLKEEFGLEGLAPSRRAASRALGGERERRAKEGRKKRDEEEEG